ncbi:MAG: hypothetical protein K2P84_01255, partial [Undibacterium sp.]|nr:hypothetical protein [Undibacterium sp.]
AVFELVFNESHSTSDLKQELRTIARLHALDTQLATPATSDIEQLEHGSQARTAHLSTSKPSDSTKDIASNPALHPSKNTEERLTLIEDQIHIHNAGLVIIAPYAQRLFDMLGLSANGQFIHAEAAQRAVHLLQYIATGEQETPEYQLVFNKLLCGIHGGIPIVLGIEMTEHEKEVIRQMLESIIAHWNALGSTSIQGLRETFLRRLGQLHYEEEAWHLKIPQSTFDMLLDRLPWSFSMIKLPWMSEALHVTWR